MNDKIRDFIREHINDDVLQLVLDAPKYKDIDVHFAVVQIAARKAVKEKLPTWYANEKFLFPSKLSAEQCSSELTGEYKKRLIDTGQSVCDLTGGLGVDAFSFASKATHVTYVEHNEAYCEAAAYNAKILGLNNAEIINDDAENIIGRIDADVYYIDPSRRTVDNKRVFAIADCKPDITKIWSVLKEKKYKKIIVKLSPMLDIKHIVAQLSNIIEIHILSVKNECKELLVIASTEDFFDEPLIKCVDINSEYERIFQFKISEEANTTVPIAQEIGSYLYEPDASILKAGAYKSVAVEYDLQKIDISSHLYTSVNIVKNFPGRVFRIVDTYDFSSSLCRKISSIVPQANLTVRNFPMSVDEFRKRTRISDGGDVYLFATTMQGKKLLIRCEKF